MVFLSLLINIDIASLACVKQQKAISNFILERSTRWAKNQGEAIHEETSRIRYCYDQNHFLFGLKLTLNL